MKQFSAPAGALLLAVSIAACSQNGGDQAETQDNTTAALLSQPVSDGMSTPIAADPGLAQESGPRVQVAELGFNLGEEAAIVKIVEMSDFGCGYCRRFHEESFPTLRQQFIETGMVEWKFVPYVTGMFANSLAVTEASECVMEQSADEYQVITRRLWDEQTVWKNAGEPEPVLREWIGELQVDMEQFDSCMAEDRRLNRIASATTLARQIGVRGTPTFVVIGYPPLQGALPLEFFQQVLSTVHAEETRRRAEGPSGD